MAKQKPKVEQQEPAPESKGLGAKIGDIVDHLLHPEHAETSESAPAPQTDLAAGKQSSEPESEIDQASPPSEHVESEMQDHKKFDKFNGGIS